MIDFKASYARKNVLSFLSHFLPEDFQESIEENINLNYKPQFIERVNKLGESASLQSLHIFEVFHCSENDPRVGLSRDIFRLLANFGIRKALVFFVSMKSPNYRLSLVTLDLKWEEGRKVEKEYSNPRRYSFFLGQEAKVHTPTSFLIKSGRVKNLSDLISRFDVEVVTKEFFQKYKGLFDGLCESLKKDHVFAKVTARGEISVETFAKKLLGQIVFCYFLQKKGWLGAAKDGRVVEGDKDFMRSLFERYKKEGKDYFNDGLEYLFYDALNRTPEGDDYYRSHFKCQIPFLNGGLFEPLQDYDWKGEFLYLSDDLFSNKKGTGILDVFDLYNFTVYEDDLIDREVSVDPEMLGKVFENLLPENIRKGQGAYYTPREIVHYMCQESLVNSLIANTKVGEERIRELVHDKELSFDQRKCKAAAWRKEKDELIFALKGIRVCDPACGSGAFLVGMLHEIVEICRFLEEEENTYQIRKQAIQNSIYGVDIDPGAVEIAKLRLWLSLVVDYQLDDIEPLPNLDYKIMCGNSLLEGVSIGDEVVKLVDEAVFRKVNGKKIDDSLFNAEALKGKGSEGRRVYFLQERDSRQKELLSLHGKGLLTKEIRVRLEAEIVSINKVLEPQKSKVREVALQPTFFIDKAGKYFNQLKELHAKYFSESDPARKKVWRTQIELIEMEFIKASVQSRVDEIDTRIRNLNMQDPADREMNEALLRRRLELLEIPGRITRERVRPYFLWRLNFCDVFEEKGGFDVVIANPPYISIEKFARTALQAAWKQSFRNTFASRGDIYCLFYEKGFALLRNNGVLAFISSNKFQRAGYGEGLRIMLSAQRIHVLIDFCELPVFAAATDPMIVIVSKAETAVNREFPVLVVKDEAEIGSLNQSVESRATQYKQGQLKAEGWSLDGGGGLALIEKLRAKNTPLGEYVNGRFYYGIKTGLNEAFVIDRATRDGLVREDKKSKELIMPWIRGKDIKRWAHDFNELYVIIVRFGFHNELRHYPAILRHLSRFEDKLKARGQCRTSRNGTSEGQHHWLELDNNPSESYIAAFAEPKIVYNETSKRLHAYLDLEGNAINKTGFIILAPDVLFILAVLNSTLMDWLYRSTFPSWGDPWGAGRIQFRGNLMNRVPIPHATPVDKAHLTKLAQRAAKLASAGEVAELSEVDREIDVIVNRLFKLTSDEVAYIENSLVNTRSVSFEDDIGEDE